MILRRLYIYIYNFICTLHTSHTTKTSEVVTALSFWLYSRKRFPVKDSLLPYLQAAGARGGAGRRRRRSQVGTREETEAPSLASEVWQGTSTRSRSAEILFVSPRAGTIGTSFVPETFRRKTDPAFRSHLYVTRRTAKRKT